MPKQRYKIFLLILIFSPVFNVFIFSNLINYNSYNKEENELFIEQGFESPNISSLMEGLWYIMNAEMSPHSRYILDPSFFEKARLHFDKATESQEQPDFDVMAALGFEYHIRYTGTLAEDMMTHIKHL